MSEEKEQPIQESSPVEKDSIKAPQNSTEKVVSENESQEESQTGDISSKKEGAKVETDVLEEIDESNAEDAEDTDTVKRHEIPMPDYHEMSMENLVGELQRLVKNEKVQAIRKHVDSIKDEFNQKFDEFLEGKKEEFLANGGNEIDFKYNSVAKRQFNEVYSDYREKRNQHYKSLGQMPICSKFFVNFEMCEMCRPDT